MTTYYPRNWELELYYPPKHKSPPPSTTQPSQSTATLQQKQKIQTMNPNKSQSVHNPENYLTLASLNLTDSEISEIGSDSDSEEDISTGHRRHPLASGLSNIFNEEFYTEAEESLSRAFLENHSVENAMIELKTLRMATNVTFHEVREAIVSALMGIVITQPTRVGAMFGKWGEL